MSVVRYIHQNPLKAKIVHAIEQYRFSSYIDYIACDDAVIDRAFVMGMMDIEAFVVFHIEEEKEIFCVSDSIKVSEEGIRREIVKVLGLEPNGIGALSRKERDKILAKLKEKYSIRQLERVTGVSRGIIAKAQ